MDQTELSAILFSNNKNVEFVKQLNIVLKQLIDEDTSYVSKSKASPSLWECRWMNGQSGSNGYPKGYAVWLNTNTYQQMVAYHHDAIESYATNNPILDVMYKSIDKSDAAAMNDFLLSVANGTASKQVSAMYYLGDVSKDVQVRVSLVDDNKDYPNSKSWKDFYTYTTYDENVKMLSDAAVSCIKDAVSEHVKQYHLSNDIDFVKTKLSEDGYFKRYPFEVSSVQTQDFYDHTYCNSMEGFDFVKRWKMAYDGSSWCRVWNSGYIEQGGFVYNIPGEALIPVEFMTTYNYPAGAAFYQRDYQTYDTQYDISNPLQANNRYVATVTPVLADSAISPYPSQPLSIGNEILYASTDMTNMSNHGFSIVNTDILAERYIKYMWHVCGYKVLGADSTLFDNPQQQGAPLDAFEVVDGVLMSFSNGNYIQAAIPSNVHTIGDNVFNGQSTIKVFILPNGLSCIGSDSFARCIMSGISLPNSVKKIDDGAFRDCSQLAYASFGPDVDVIGTSAFCNDVRLMNVSRLADADPGHTFDIVGDYAFYNTALKKVNLSLRSSSIYTFWGDYCFAECKDLEEANILSSCYMSTGMFKGCTKLKFVNFKNNQTSYVYPRVFEGCTALSTITLPSKIWYISEEMFKGCTSLKSIKFSTYDEKNSVLNLIQKNAFYGCSQLQTLDLPASLTSLNELDDACLSNCALTSISFHGISKDQIVKASPSSPSETPSSDSTDILVDRIMHTGMFRLNHNCRIICKDGDTVQYVYDRAQIVPYVAPPNYTLSVDHSTYSEFMTASAANAANKFWWYYNAQQLKAQADRDHTPCLFIWSLLGCDPCQIYSKEIFNNKTFQDWCARQNFYLCGLEVDKQPYYDTQLAFCRDILAPGAINVFDSSTKAAEAPESQKNALGNSYYIQTTAAGQNSNLYTPVLIFYWKRADGTIISWAHTFHDISRLLQNFGVDGTIGLVQRLCLNYFENNDISSPNGYVVGVDTPFDKKTYTEGIENPYQSTTPYVIIPRESDAEDSRVLTSIGEVNQNILDRYADYFGTNYYTDPAHVVEYSVVDSNGNIYFGGCAASSIGYISYTFSGIADGLSPAQMAALVNSGANANYRFKIGDKYYKFGIDASATKEVFSPCIADEHELGGKIVWTEIAS